MEFLSYHLLVEEISVGQGQGQFIRVKYRPSSPIDRDIPFSSAEPRGPG